MQVDIGFWNEKGKYIEQIEEITMEEEKEITKEIIIDGVNVAECRLRVYNSDLCNGFKMDNSGFHQGHCKQNPNCYFKQLKRLQAENEELKKIIETQNPWNNCNNCNKDYKQALEEIRGMFKSGNNCLKCQTKCENKDILKVISEVLNGN